jgi:hypothetical protein
MSAYRQATGGAKAMRLSLGDDPVRLFSITSRSGVRFASAKRPKRWYRRSAAQCQKPTFTGPTRQRRTRPEFKPSRRHGAACELLSRHDERSVYTTFYR